MSGNAFRRRPARTIPAVLTAVVLLGLAVAAVWAGIAALTGTPAGTDGVAAAAATPWSSQSAYIPSIALAIIGLGLIVVALTPGRHRSHVVVHDGQAPSALRDSGLQRILDDEARELDGVDSARTSVRGRKATVRVDTYLLDRNEVKSRTARALQDRLGQLGLKRAPSVSVDVTTRKG